MSWQGILLVLFSATCHAAWNLLSKSSGGPIAFSRQALRWSAICYLLPILLIQPQVVYSPRYLICVVTSGVAVGLFFLFLSLAYQHGQVSVAYPIARSFPILVVTWVAMLWGRYPSGLGLGGILLIMVGCFVLPMQRFTLGPEGFAPGNYFNRSCFWALMAALATSVFAIIDKIAAGSIVTKDFIPSLLTGVNYVYLQNLVAAGVMEVSTFRLKQPAPASHRPHAIAAGLIFLVSYTLIILALEREPVAYVVSFRQISIVIAAVVSLIWIEKQAHLPRMAGIALIFVGVMLIGVA
jgi:uncharacterized membrane protein